MRQYLASNMPDKNGVLTISGKDFKYLSQVLRLDYGEEIWVRFPDEKLVKMVVGKIQSKQIILNPCSEPSCDEKENPADKEACEANAEENIEANKLKLGETEYWVFQFVPMHAQLDLIIRQCVECGIAKIVPVIGTRSPRLGKQAIEAKAQRFDRLVKEARQQSGSPVNTQIFKPMSLESALKLWSDANENCVDAISELQNTAEKNDAQDKKILKSDIVSAEKNISVNSVAFVLHEADIADKSLFEHASSALKSSKGKIKKVALAVGPEGGMTNEEVSSFKEAGFKLIHFETNVLRCETACLYGIAAIQSTFTEYKSWQKSE